MKLIVDVDSQEFLDKVSLFLGKCFIGSHAAIFEAGGSQAQRRTSFKMLCTVSLNCMPISHLHLSATDPIKVSVATLQE
jgi:hypothetical protein